MEATLACVANVLARQRGLITWSQLRYAEVHEDRVRRLVERKVLRRVQPRVYALVGAPESWERALHAAVLSIEGAAASHAAAARLWGFVDRPEERLEVTVSRRHRSEVTGVRTHRSRHLCGDDVTTVSGIRCTTYERTLCDCTTLLSERELGRVLDDGLRRGTASLRGLRDCAERIESGPGRHMSVIRSLLAVRNSAYDPGGSDREVWVLGVLRRAGIPAPVQQYRIEVGAKTYRPDFAWPEIKVFAEYYGLAYHTGASAVENDSARLTALSTSGWLPVILTRACTERDIVEGVTAALAQRGVGTLTGATRR